MNIHDGHLCGGAINGKGGTCVGKCKQYHSLSLSLAKIKHFNGKQVETGIFFCHAYCHLSNGQ